MFLAAVLNAYLRPADEADGRPVIELNSSEPVEAPEGLVLAKVRTPAAQDAPVEAPRTRVRW
jgi:hypothetical protein